MTPQSELEPGSLGAPELRAALAALAASDLCSVERRRLERALAAGRWAEALLAAKRSMMAQEASDAQLEALDACMEALFLMDPRPDLGLGAQAELFALLPPDRIGALALGWRPEPAAKGVSPLHWLCLHIGSRGLLEPAQRDFFAPSQLALLQASLLACARARPDWLLCSDEAGQSPLHWAVYFLALEAIPPLLSLGADPHAPNAMGSPAFDPDFFRLYVARAQAPARARERAEALWRLMERQCLSDATAAASEGEGSGRKRL